MLPSQLKDLYEAYSEVYAERNDDIDTDTDILIEEVIEELIQECVEFGYDLDEAAELVEEAATEYLMELNPYAPAGSKAARAYQKSTTATKRGEARKAAVKGAVERVKSKAKGVAAAAGIAGSIAKDEARRAGRGVAHAAGKAAGAVHAAASKKKEEVKKGVKSLLGRGLRKAAGAAGAVAQKARKAGAAAGRAAERLGEETQQLDELSDKKVQKTLKARERRFDRSVDSGAPNKEFHQLRRTEKLVASRNRRTGSNIPVDEEYVEVDVFDYILEHLVAEGYADTNQAALVIMANMSEEWREEILEGSYEDRIAANNKKYDAARKRAAQRAAARNAARDAGKTGSVPGVGYVTPRRENETYRDSAGTQRHHSGAKMP